MRMKIKLFLFSALFFFLGASNSSASHLMGAEMEYQCIGNGKYKIILRVYRDCNGIQVSQSNIVARSGSSTLNISNQKKVSVRDITLLNQACPDKSRCRGFDIPYGMEEHVWEAELNLSNYSNCEWHLSWSQSARNDAITTGQSNQNFYTEAVINKCVAPCNSSPNFSIAPTPVAVICNNRDITYNCGAMDTVDSGDSLSYELVEALVSLNYPASYNSGFSPTSPLTYLGSPNANLALPYGFHLNPVTGDLQFRPTATSEIAVVVIEVKEWRKVNGTMQVIGRTRRDMQFIITSCPSNANPTLSGPYNYETCAGKRICVPIQSSDSNSNDTVMISWNKGIKGASFSQNNGSVRLANGQLCWTPSEQDISSTPHNFIVTAIDNNCPIAGNTVKNYSILVRPADTSITASLNLTKLPCRKVALDHSKDPGLNSFPFQYIITDQYGYEVWNSQQKQDTLELSSGSYTAYLSFDLNSTCHNIISDTFSVSGIGNENQTQVIDACDGQQILIKPKYENSGQAYIYDWRELNNSTILSSDSQYNYIASASKTIYGIAQVGPCFIHDTTVINWFARPNAHFSAEPDTTCLRNPGIQFRDSSTYLGPQPLHRLWSYGDSIFDTTANPLHTYASTGSYHVALISFTSASCADTSFKDIVIAPNPILSTVANHLNGTPQSSVQFQLNQVHPAAKYQWQTVDNGTFLNLKDSGQYSGTQSSILTVADINASNNNQLFRCIVFLGNCRDSSNTALLTVASGTGFNSNIPLSNIKIYPNPAKQILTIENNAFDRPLEFKILNSLGTCVFENKLTKDRQSYDISQLSSGVYMVVFDSNQNTRLVLVKQ